MSRKAAKIWLRFPNDGYGDWKGTRDCQHIRKGNKNSSPNAPTPPLHHNHLQVQQ